MEPKHVERDLERDTVRGGSVSKNRRDGNDDKPTQRSRIARLLHENGLSLVLAAFFLVLLVGQSIAGHLAYNEEQRSHGEATITYSEYLRSSHFGEATFENWESEFLQMAVYVLFTAFLFQKGSAESKDPYGEDSQPKKPPPPRECQPWPVRRGGLWRALYANSLGIAFGLIFLLSFALHAWSGARRFSQEQIEHGQPAVSVWDFVSTSQFWFESMQNWQSEFLAILAMVVLSIFLRQKGSPESKEVDRPHSETGA